MLEPNILCRYILIVWLFANSCSLLCLEPERNHWACVQELDVNIQQMFQHSRAKFAVVHYWSKHAWENQCIINWFAHSNFSADCNSPQLCRFFATSCGLNEISLAHVNIYYLQSGQVLCCGFISYKPLLLHLCTLNWRKVFPSYSKFFFLLPSPLSAPFIFQFHPYL